jgi:hypothetical protein
MNELATDTVRAITEVAPMLIPIVGSIGLFSFLAVATWADSRRREREAFFRHELLKKIAENPGGNADQVMALLRQEEIDRVERLRDRLRLGGWITFAVGMGVSLLISQLVRVRGLWAVGAIPSLIGVALLLGAFGMPKKMRLNR